MRRLSRYLLSITFCIASASVAPAQWFASNALGLALDRIDVGQRSEYEYTLNVVTMAGGEERTLFRDGEHVERRVVTREAGRRLEQVYVQDRLDEVLEFNAQGRLIREESYAGGTLDQIKRYSYQLDRPATLTVSNSEGQLVYSETYEYWRTGSVRSVDREWGPASAVEGSRHISYTYRDRRLIEEWIDTGELTERFLFDDTGFLALREVRGRSNGTTTLLEREERAYREDGSLWSVRVFRYDENESVLRQYDQSGRPAESVTRREGVVVERVTRSYADGLVQTETRFTADLTERWEYRYGSPGDDAELLEERYYVNDRLQRVVRYEADNRRVEEIYQDGRPVLRAYFAEETRLREEVLQDGDVVRVREFDRASSQQDR